MGNIMIEQIAIASFLLLSAVVIWAILDSKAEKKLIQNIDIKHIDIKNTKHLNSH